MFKAGYLSKTHKHADDISFMLYSKGYDILVDPGWYNYMSGNKYRDYFISSGAHNTVIVDNHSYSPTVENSSKTGIFSLNQGEDFDEVIAFNNMYSGVSIDRHFFYGGDTIILIDDIRSEEEHEYSQLFQLSEYMSIESATDDEVVAVIGESGYKLRIHQLGAGASLNVIDGDTQNAQYGFLSRVMNDVQSINTLKWDVKGKNVELVTVLTIEDENGIVLSGKNEMPFVYDSIRKEGKKVIFSGEEKTMYCEWEERERYSFDDIDISINENEVNLENRIDAPDLWNYAWYIINVDTAEVTEKIMYNENNSATVSLNNEGTFFVKAYMLSKNGQERASKVVAALRKNQDGIQDVTEQYPYLNLEYLGHSVEKIDDQEDTWRFTVNYNYSWNSTIAWYIYKDGGIWFSENVKDSNYRDYQFTEPGSYTVMYYLRTSNGDNEFWNFSQITVEDNENK